MQQFKQLLVTLQHTLLQGNLEQTITELVFDSRKAKEGTLFCCIVGTQTDGHQYAQQAYQQGEPEKWASEARNHQKYLDRVAALKAQGAVILTWTITSAAIEARAREVADNVTFEGYLAARPA